MLIFDIIFLKIYVRIKNNSMNFLLDFYINDHVLRLLFDQIKIYSSISHQSYFNIYQSFFIRKINIFYLLHLPIFAKSEQLNKY